MRPTSRRLLSTGLLAATFLALQLRTTGEAVSIRQPLEAFPTTVGEWQGREATLLEGDILSLLKVKDYLVRRYVDVSGRSLWLYIAYWDTQRKGAHPHTPQNCLPGSGWEPLEMSRLEISLGPSRAPLTVNRYLVQKERDQQLVLYWYHAQGKAVPGEVQARVEMVRSAMLRNRTDGALVRVSSPVYTNPSEATERLVRYVQVLFPALSAYLPD